MFEKELRLIKNPLIKRITEQGVELVPDYFYHVSASSSGKYHPNYAIGDGGLYRHVQAAVLIAGMLFTIHDFTSDEKDMIVASLILHDGWKQGMDGSDGHTLFAHPIIAQKVLIEKVGVETSEEREFLTQIGMNISSHMGQWNRNPYEPNIILPLPETPMQKFVHLCDYLASRKPLEFNFAVV